MQLIEKDWDNPGGCGTRLVDYPDSMVQELVNWLRQTSAWKENPEMVERKMIQFDRKAVEWRTAQANSSTSDTAQNQRVAVAPEPVESVAALQQEAEERKAEIRERRLAGLRRVNEARKAAKLAAG